MLDLSKLFLMAEQDSRERRFETASKRYRVILAYLPSEPNVLHSYGISTYQSGRAGEATQLIERALSVSPEFAQAALNLGLIAQRQERWDVALSRSGRAIRTQPDLLPAHALHAATLRQLGRPDEAAAAYRRLVALHPAHDEAFFRLAELLLWLAGMAGVDAGATAAPEARAHAAARRRRFTKEAVTALRRRLACAPSNPANHLNLAVTLYDHGEHETAEDAATTALARFPEQTSLLGLLGRIQLARHRPTAAERSARLGLSLAPADAALLTVLGQAQEKDGALRAAAVAFRRATALTPRGLDAHLGLGRVSEALGDTETALSAYERAMVLGPGFGFAFSRRASLLLRHVSNAAGGGPPRPLSGRRRVSMSTLGANGRFGNQLLQYGFLRFYAAEHDLDIEVPDWPGRYLFDLDDPGLTTPLPPLDEHAAPLLASLNREVPEVYADRDLRGFFCYDTGGYARFRNLFRDLFRPSRRLAPLVEAASAHLRERGRTVVAIHLRRGDFGWGPFWIAPEEWYRTWLTALWDRLDRPVLYCATDAPQLAAAFAAFSPLTAADFPPLPAGAEFFLDFHLLTQADILAISNSTFSFTASMLNTRAREFHRPDRALGGLRSYDPWNSPVLI